MNYDDEALLTAEGYSEMAKAYKQTLKHEGFIFVCLDKSEFDKNLHDIFAIMGILRDNLLALGGFLGTSALFNLNEKQLLSLHKMFDCGFEYKKTKFVNDKTKLLLNMFSLENQLVGKMLDLAFCCDKTKQIVDMIKQRTSLLGSLFQIHGIISTYFQ